MMNQSNVMFSLVSCCNVFLTVFMPLSVTSQNIHLFFFNSWWSVLLALTIANNIFLQFLYHVRHVVGKFSCTLWQLTFDGINTNCTGSHAYYRQPIVFHKKCAILSLQYYTHQILHPNCCIQRLRTVHMPVLF